MNQAVAMSSESDARTQPYHADLAVDNLSKSFTPGTKVFDDVSFAVEQGQAVALIGANGYGKSTLLRCCLRLIRSDSGSVKLLGEDITKLKGARLRSVRSKVGFVFQKHNLVPRLSVLSNVLHGGLSRSRSPRLWYQGFAPGAEREYALQCLDQVGLAEFASRRANSLSGGQSQRVAIARALMQRPKMIFADEPVASLDPNAGEEVMNLFLKLTKDHGITFVFVSHHLEHALGYSDRILGLRSGRLHLDSTPSAESVSSLRGIYD